MNKIICITTDNGANVKAACSLMQVRHLPCFAHTLNLCVHDGLSKDEHLTHLLTKCRSIVTYFKRSNNAMDLLKKEQDRMGKPHLKLLKDIDTRWNSILTMLNRIIEIGDPLIMAQVKSDKAPPPLSVIEMQDLSDLAKVLKPFDDATKQLSGKLNLNFSYY